MGSRENRKAPLVLVFKSCANPVCTFNTLTAASGMPAPLESATVPPRLAVVNCAEAVRGDKQTISARIIETRNIM
jgi:hypothetical protein